MKVCVSFKKPNKVRQNRKAVIFFERIFSSVSVKGLFTWGRVGAVDNIVDNIVLVLSGIIYTYLRFLTVETSSVLLMVNRTCTKTL